MTRPTLLALGLCGWAVSASPAAAQPGAAQPATAAEVDAEVEEARRLFRDGVVAVKDASWSNALVAFENSARLRPHATTTFNIGAVERALGRYTRARETFATALAQNQERPGELAPSLEGEARGFIAEIDRLVARVTVTLDPPSAAIAVDGRPLTKARRDAGDAAALLAGVAEPGPGTSLQARSFDVLLNPGAHVFTLSRRGYTDAVVNRTFSPGSSTTLKLELAKLPATMRVASNVGGAIVTVDGKDFGPAPVEVLRPAGTYRVVVAKPGFETYEAQVSVQAGQESELQATLVQERQPITAQWWFWTTAAAVVAGGVVVTYALTRPEPEPEPFDGGSTRWVVRPAVVRF